jgi:hypothetical protein
MSKTHSSQFHVDEGIHMQYIDMPLLSRPCMEVNYVIFLHPLNTTIMKHDLTRKKVDTNLGNRRQPSTFQTMLRVYLGVFTTC